MAHRRLHYVLSTHWDREWYQPFQDYRYRLVQLVDRIIAGLDDGRLKGPFQADGQSVMIEDYLEVRAGQREHVQQLVQEGKIRLGPWYTMPDEFIVSGESLVRNLRLGRQVARQLGGKPSDAGFVCDIFGHNSQLPQIFAGFGIRFGFIWRGTNLASRLVRWRGADGTELPCYRFGKGGYCSYCSTVRCKFADTRVPVDVEALNKASDQFIEEELAATEVGPGLMFDGGDHLEWDPRTYALMPLGQVRHGALLIHSTLDDYIAEMLPLASQFTQVLSGELRQPGRPPLDQDTQWVIPGVLSSRAPMKQHNDRCQALLCQWAEPLGVLAGAAVDMPYPVDYLEVAWKYVLKNHAHDSICGCSIDEVHQDCAYRFRQAEQIAQRLATESTRKLAASIEPEVKEDEVRVVVFNPLAQPFEGKADLWIKVPVEWPTSNEFFGFEPKPTFQVFDAAGQEVPYQRLDQSMHVRNTRIFDIGFPKGYQTHDVRVALPLRVPAMGYTTLTVRKPEPTRSIRYPVKPGLATSERSMANEHLEVSIEANGTLTVRDKRSGQTYSRLLTFEDSADIGDGWYHGTANNDQAFVSTAGSADVALLHDGPMLCTFRVRLRMNVPRGFEKSSMGRSEQMTELVIDSQVTLRAGAEHVEVQTTVDNVAGDHRLRVLLPTGANTSTCLADSPFDVVQRPVALLADNHLYRELEVETRPQQTWTAVFDQQRGLAVVAEGLHEAAVRDLPERPLALTLFRSTQRTVFTAGQPEGQLQGRMTFRYWIVPLPGRCDVPRLCHLGQMINAGLRDIQLQALDVALHRQTKALPPTAGLVQVDGPAVVTSFRQVASANELRMFNPTDTAAEVALSFRQWPGKAPTTAQPVDLESHPVGAAIGAKEGVIQLRLKAKQILTVRLS